MKRLLTSDELGERHGGSFANVLARNSRNRIDPPQVLDDGGDQENDFPECLNRYTEIATEHWAGTHDETYSRVSAQYGAGCERCVVARVTDATVLLLGARDITRNGVCPVHLYSGSVSIGDS